MLIVGPGLAMLVSIVILIIVASGFLPAGIILVLPFISYLALACMRLRSLLRGYTIIESTRGGAQGTQRHVIDNKQIVDPT
jgi:hypothetical protein